MKNVSVLFLAFLLVNFSSSCQNSTSGSGGKLDAFTFREKINTEKEEVILDVRTPGEFAEGKIEGAVNIDFNNASFKSEIAKLDKNKTYFVYCLAGGRSAAAADEMRSSGFKTVYDLKGGINAWRQAALPIAGNNVASTDTISMDEFNKIISDTIPVLVDFYAPWCGPCKKMKPFLEEIEKEQAGKVKVVRINMDENKNLSAHLGVTELPVVLVYKKSEEKNRHVGFADKEKLISLTK